MIVQDNYNKYDTEKYRSQSSRGSREKDEEIKFSSYGDRLGSGIELARKRWTGGEVFKYNVLITYCYFQLITDPLYLKKSLKPRTMFYSPIGDGVVAADGVEWKPGPPDLTPKIHVTHERVVEYGKGRPGLRVYERTWDDGTRGNNDDDGRGKGGDGWPNDDGNKGPGWPYDNGDGDPFGKGRNGYPSDDDGWPKNASGGDPYGTLGSGDGYPRSTRKSLNIKRGILNVKCLAMSIRSDGGTPREGWTKTFITNPRELINQYGTETLTTVFDLEDHTPKTQISTKEIISSSVRRE